MMRITLFLSVLLATTSGVYAQSDEEILETIRALKTEAFLEQIADTLPKYFLNSGLAPSDKERVVQTLANEYVACFEHAAVEYAVQKGMPLSDLVSSDGGIEFVGDSGTDFMQLYEPCILSARQAAGLSGE